MQDKGIFITGTDTEVGKTVVCAGVVSILSKAGVDAVPMKPIQTGAVEAKDGFSSPDLEFSVSMSGLKISKEKKRLMAPFCFKHPCSPHLASTLAGRKIDMAVILSVYRRLQSEHPAVIVEGAGGVLVPIAGEKTMLDLMIALALPVVLVSRPGLGTINHTMLSLRELRRAGLCVLGVVIVETEPGRGGYIEEDNINTIERLGRVRVLGHIPFIPDLGAGRTQRAVFQKTCSARLPAAAEWIDWLKGSE